MFVTYNLGTLITRSKTAGPEGGIRGY